MLGFPKPEARIVHTIQKRRKAARMDQASKELVRKRDRESCRICGRRSRDVHERVFKSRGGTASLVNSLVLCRQICHALVQQHAVQVYGPTCNDRLTFEMTQAVGHLIFNGRAVPPHVTVL